MNPDIENERKGASFVVEELSTYLDGGKKQTERKNQILDVLEKENAFRKDDLPFMSRTERHKRALEGVYTLQKLKMQHKWTREDRYLILRHMDIYLPSTLHESMMTFCLTHFADDEQCKRWIPLAESMKFIGTYAQTELGHGSNVRGLETTATYIPETEQFEMHSPTLTSTKWWPGGLGKISTHAVVFARLVVKGKDYGIHQFFVQLRSLENHEPLPGVTVGDIGPKFAFETVDNGFLRFNKVRIPRDHMLAKFATDGTYSKRGNDRMTYGAMSMMRFAFIAMSESALAKAATISVRYSAVRRQFGEGGVEKQVLDYQTQQHRVLPALATAYALHFAVAEINIMNEKLAESISKGDSSVLPELHAVSAGLKSWVTTFSYELIEQCRLACGGHGYSKFSGLPDLYANYVHLATAEGENYLLTQQTARYLIKNYQIVREGKKVTGSTSYLNDIDTLLEEKCTANTDIGFMNAEVILRAFEHRAARIIHLMAVNLQGAIGRGDSPSDAWNSVLLDAYRASRAHSMYMVVRFFALGLDHLSSKEDPSFSSIESQHEAIKEMWKLFQFFSLYLIEKDLGEFTEDGYLNAYQAEMIRNTIKKLLPEIRMQAVPLVDAFGLRDWTLASALGRYDGNVYQALYDWAQKEPLNKTQVVDGYEQYLKPLLRGDLQKSKL